VKRDTKHRGGLPRDAEKEEENATDVFGGIQGMQGSKSAPNARENTSPVDERVSERLLEVEVLRSRGLNWAKHQCEESAVQGSRKGKGGGYNCPELAKWDREHSMKKKKDQRRPVSVRIWTRASKPRFRRLRDRAHHTPAFSYVRRSDRR